MMRPAKRTSRRNFLAGASASLAALTLPTGRVLGANRDVRLAVIGLGGKGRQHARDFSELPGARLVALCDVDPKRLGEQTKRFDRVFSSTDPRQILDRRDIDAVVIATPDHWHALLAVWACRTGRHVYVEKPVSHNIWEGRQIIEAAARYGCIVQAGTQYRSDAGLQEAAQYISEGNLGKVIRGHVLWYERRGSIGKVPPHVPGWLDYDLYCGPAPVRPLRREKLHYDWHWVWSTGTGDLGNSGIHAFDVCRWFAGHNGLPPRAMCLGGRFAVDDAGQTPNTQLTVLDYESAPIIIENRNLPSEAGANAMDQLLGVREGIILRCENGYFAGLRGGGWAYDNDGQKLQQFKGDGGGQHQANFIEAIRDENPGLLNAPIAEGHISSACCHLGNLSYRLGEESDPERLAQAVDGSELAAETFERLARHLDANLVDLREQPWTLGPWLTIDRDAETISGLHGVEVPGGLAAANRLVRGSYREPFVVPEDV
jgi:predicted dehydrogenase